MAEREMFPSNSQKSRAAELTKPERRHAQAIAQRAEIKESAGRRFIKLFLAEDVDDIGEYVIKDLIIPNVKDVFFNFLWALLWGDRKVGGFNSTTNKTPYYKASQVSKIRTIGSNQKKDDTEETAALKELDLTNIQFASQAEAKEVLMAMKMYLDDYPAVPVGYFKELINETGSWTSEYYGWTDLSDAKIRPTSRGGWMLILPRPVRL